MHDFYAGIAHLDHLFTEPHAACATRLSNIRPNSGAWHISAARALLALKPPQREQAQAHVLKAEKLPMTSAVWFDLSQVRLFDAEEAWVRNDVSAALRIIERIDIEGKALPQPGRFVFVQAALRGYLTLGQFKRAESLLSRVDPTARPNLLAIALVAREDRSALRDALRRRPIEETAGIASALLEAGMLDESHNAIAVLQQRDIGEQRRKNLSNRYLSMVKVQLAVAEKRYDDAIASFDARATSPGANGNQIWRSLSKLGIAYLAKGQVERGIAALEAALSPAESPRQVLGLGFEWLFMRERLAQLYRAAGRVADAEIEAELLQLLAVADDDHPIKRRLLQQRREADTQ